MEPPGAYAPPFSPVWESSPAFADIVAAYPDAARTAPADGSASIGCVFDATDRSPTRCHVDHEQPVGYGFGEAALALAPRFRLSADLQNLPWPAPNVRGYSVRFFRSERRLDTPAVGGPDLTYADLTWSAWPTSLELGRFYPERAQRLGIAGQVTARCSIASDGSLRECAVVAEQPAGYEFGAALMRVAGAAAVAGAKNGGSVAGRRMLLKMSFALPMIAPPAPKPAAAPAPSTP